jgi:hypothetical protein
MTGNVRAGGWRELAAWAGVVLLAVAALLLTVLTT